MDTVKEILVQLGIESVREMDLNESHCVEVPGYEKLTIEKVGSHRISVAHHYTQRGDLMCDPEIVFQIEEGEWIPIEFTQHPMVYHYDEGGLDLGGFVDRWNRNLRQQGFVEAVRD